MPLQPITGSNAPAHLPVVDETISTPFSTEAGEPHALLFFAGDPAQRRRRMMWRSILPELIAAFAGRLRGAIVAPEAESGSRAGFRSSSIRASS